MPFDSHTAPGRTADRVDVHVGRQLRLARKDQRVSQERMAEALGLTFQQVQKYERGDNRISASKMYAAAKLLRIPVAYFFQGLPDTITPGDAVMMVPAAGKALVDQPHGRELHTAFFALGHADRALLATLAQRMAAAAERG